MEQQHEIYMVGWPGETQRSEVERQLMTLGCWVSYEGNPRRLWVKLPAGGNAEEIFKQTAVDDMFIFSFSQHGDMFIWKPAPQDLQESVAMLKEWRTFQRPQVKIHVLGRAAECVLAYGDSEEDLRTATLFIHWNNRRLREFFHEFLGHVVD